MSRRSREQRPENSPANGEQTPESAVSKESHELEAENEELRRKVAAGRLRQEHATRRQRLEDENEKLKAELAKQNAAEFPDDAAIEGVASLLYPDPTTLPEEMKDPNLVYYWANGGDDGKMKQLRYRKVDPQPKDHPMVLQGMVLWVTARKAYEQRKAAERALANAVAKKAAELKPQGIPGKQLVTRDEREAQRDQG
jgi:hypothetical protein